MEYDPSNTKARFRRAKAKDKLLRFDEAFSDLQLIVISNSEYSQEHNILDLMKNVGNNLNLLSRFRMEQIENDKKCKVSYVNGHDLIFEDERSDERVINVLDMGMNTPLNTKSVYKDTMMRELYAEWSIETGIPCEHLMIWNYTERKNKTLRPNRQIKFDLNEECKTDPNGEYTEDQIKRHLIETKPRTKMIKSIYQRIGDVLENKRKFMLLDTRNVKIFHSLDQIDCKNKMVLVALKYFATFEQKSYFIDWIMFQTESITFGQIADYVQNELIPKTKCKRAHFQQLHQYIEQMKKIKNEELFCILEEEAVLTNKSNSKGPVCKIIERKHSEVVDDDFCNGDIFVFQLNPFHSYFDCCFKSDGWRQEKMKLHRSNGFFWHSLFAKFMHAQTTMTRIEINEREDTGWEQRWQKALIMQYPKNHR